MMVGEHRWCYCRGKRRASCGITQVDGDDVKKMKNCACKIVQYCSVACQTEHRSEHKRACKKRVAELRDEILFKQPESSCFGDCPICCLPISIDKNNLGWWIVAANWSASVVVIPIKFESGKRGWSSLITKLIGLDWSSNAHSVGILHQKRWKKWNWMSWKE